MADNSDTTVPWPENVPISISVQDEFPPEEQTTDSFPPAPDSDSPPPEYQAEPEPIVASEGQVNVICTTQDEEPDIKTDPEICLPNDEAAFATPVSSKVDHVHVEIKEKPNDYIELSICACFLNFFFGMIAFNYSLRARKAWKDGDRRTAKRHGWCALGWSLMALVIIAAIIVIVVWIKVVMEVNMKEMEEVMEYTTINPSKTA